MTECKTCGKQPSDSLRGIASNTLTERYLFLPNGVKATMKMVCDDAIPGGGPRDAYIVMQVNWGAHLGANVTIITPPDGGMIA